MSKEGIYVMARINLDSVGISGKLHTRKVSVKSRSKKYKKITEEADRRIDEAQRRNADAYQRASTFVAR